MNGVEVSLTGAAIGALGGVGVLLVVAGARGRAIRLDERLAPYLRTHDRTSALLRDQPTRTPFPTVERLVTPVLVEAGRALERFGSTSTDVRRRLARAGRHQSVEQFRARQLVWGVVGLALGTLFAIVLAATRGSSVVLLVLLALLCGVGGILACDHALTRALDPTADVGGRGAEPLERPASVGEHRRDQALDRRERRPGRLVAEEHRRPVVGTQVGREALVEPDRPTADTGRDEQHPHPAERPDRGTRH